MLHGSYMSVTLWWVALFTGKNTPNFKCVSTQKKLHFGANCESFKCVRKSRTCIFGANPGATSC